MIDINSIYFFTQTPAYILTQETVTRLIKLLRADFNRVALRL